MNWKTASLLAFAIILTPLRAEDYLKEIQEENGVNNDSALTKTSSDHRIKVTLLYIGPVLYPAGDQVFVLVYMVEDIRSADDLARHHATPTADGHFTDGQYLLTTYPPEIKDGSHELLKNGGSERARTYQVALEPDFMALYPNVTIPKPDHPDKAGVYEYFYKSVAKGPFDITLHDRIAAYGPNDFHFGDIDAASFKSH